MLSLMLVVGNALRDLLNLLISHQLPISYILTFIGYLLPFLDDLFDPMGNFGVRPARIRQAFFR